MEAIEALIKQTVVSCLMLGVMMAAFFASAGRIDLPQALWFFGATFVYLTASNLILYKLSPKLLSARLTMRRKGSKTWDEALMRIANLTAMLGVPAVAGLDVGRYGWSQLGILHLGLGFVLFVASSILVVWAMVENPFFEATVRIQGNRGHRVVSSGPYAFIRHPGYLAGMIWIVSIPLIIGSLYAFVPVAIYCSMFILRTYLEDKTLHKELEGYAEYARKVRYRLIPGVW